MAGYIGHHAIAQLARVCSGSLTVITQNIDGLQNESFEHLRVPADLIAEVHGRNGLFKCLERRSSDNKEDLLFICVHRCPYAKSLSLTRSEVRMALGQPASPTNLPCCPR